MPCVPTAKQHTWQNQRQASRAAQLACLVCHQGPQQGGLGGEVKWVVQFRHVAAGPIDQLISGVALTELGLAVWGRARQGRVFLRISHQWAAAGPTPQLMPAAPAAPLCAGAATWPPDTGTCAGRGNTLGSLVSRRHAWSWLALTRLVGSRVGAAVLLVPPPRVALLAVLHPANEQRNAILGLALLPV